MKNNLLNILMLFMVNLFLFSCNAQCDNVTANKEFEVQ
jgi:hypothetical protein